jgi:uncharacterized membrane protein
MNNWTTLDELVQNLIAVGVVGVTLVLEAAHAFNELVTVPPVLEAAAGAVLVAYGYKVVRGSKSGKGSSSTTPDPQADEGKV